MLSQTLFIALAGVASADMMLARDASELTARDSVVSSYSFTATNEAESKCSSAYVSVWSDAPGAPFNYMDFQGCNGLPSSLTAAASSYQKVAASWWDAHTSGFSVINELCSGIATIIEVTSRPTCTYTGTDLATTRATTGPSAGQTVASSSTSTAASTSTSGSSSSSSSGSAPTGAAANSSTTGSNPSAGHRETGMAWAAVAIAGVFGAAALL